MLNIDISSDIDAAIAGVGDFFRSQIPYAVSVALNNSAFDVRHEIVTETWPRAFKVRNRALPGRLFRVQDKATKAKLSVMVAQDLDRDWTERQATGGTKTGHSGGRVAVPAKPDEMRTSSGRIKASMKPRRIEGQRGIFAIKTGGKTLILKRRAKDRSVDLLYAVVPSARIAKRFAFEEDATATALRVFPGYWRLAMNAAISTSRFKGP